MASRKLTRQLENLTSWVEDAVNLILEAMLANREPISDYLRREYPESMAYRRRAPQDDKRRTLQHRLSFLLRYLYRCRQEYLRLQRWQFAGLEGMLNIFSTALEQSLGKDAPEVDKFNIFLDHLRQVWDEGSCPWDNAEEMGEKMLTLHTELPALFEELRDAFLAREKAAAEKTRLEKHLAEVTDTLAALREGQDEIKANQEKALRQQRKSLRQCERIVGGGEVLDEDIYSREAGLDAYPGARGRELRQAIAMSHAEYPVVLNARKGEPSLRSLAKRCWLANQTEFEKFAALPTEPGFKNWQSLSTALYTLVKKYPQADH
ncbi:MAG: hypothetical protein MJ240_13325, partial [Kiritimatiellae bacterium]|nr:hypothetical protein [Kiritimatiellia bacterium]